MLQSLLRERFGLSAHRGMRVMPVYALLVSRRDGVVGPHLRRTSAEASTECAAQRASRSAPNRSDGRPCGIGITGGTIKAGDATLAQLLGLLSPLVGRVAVNKTQLEGAFDFELTWTPDQLRDFKPSADLPPGTLPRINGVPFDPDGPSLFTALREQLGLKLESERGPVEVLVIDHVEKPAPD
jgi:uncharacterized protein (TIGR03435 family)